MTTPLNLSTFAEYAGAVNTPVANIPNMGEITLFVTAPATGTLNYDAITSSVVYYTSNATGNWTLNLRGNATTTFNNFLQSNQTVTLAMLVTQGGSAFYNNALTIDGVSVTPKWQGGTAPTAGNASSIDIYTYTIVKSASATYYVFASQTKFA